MFKVYVNLFSTFLIGGIWHGAGWTFVFWGFLHGIAVVLHRIWSGFGVKLNRWLAWFVTFNFINITWIFFRAKDWEDAVKVLTSMLKLDNIVLHPILEQKLSFLNQYGVKFSSMFINIGGGYLTVVWIIMGFLIVLLGRNTSSQLIKFRPSIMNLVIYAVISSFSILSIYKFSEFLYFNF
jgi:hypothetical protein